MENLNFVCFFPVIRIRASKKTRKQKRNLICNKTLSSPAALVRQSLLFFTFIPEEKKSVISNFLIVIVLVLYCVPLWFFCDLFMKFMLFFFPSFCSSARTWHKKGSLLLLFKLNSMEFKETERMDWGWSGKRVMYKIGLFVNPRDLRSPGMNPSNANWGVEKSWNLSIFFWSPFRRDFNLSSGDGRVTWRSNSPQQMLKFRMNENDSRKKRQNTYWPRKIERKANWIYWCAFLRLVSRRREVECIIT